MHIALDEALEESADVRDAFFRWLEWAEVAAPFDGGLESWPNRMVDGMAAAKREWRLVQSYVAREAQKAVKRG